MALTLLPIGLITMAGNVPNKSLGQHWLKDQAVLSTIADSAGLVDGDYVLEVGPGPGTLTATLLQKGAIVTAVEYDAQLASTLALSLGSPKNLTVVYKDILAFNFSTMPAGYKVVANIPYYLTSKLIRVLSESNNPPAVAVLLIQKEVAERVCAAPGDMSLLSVSAQVYFKTQLGTIVPAHLFTPPPKVNSQVVIMTRRSKPLVDAKDQKSFFWLVKAGFSERRKKLRSSLSGGLGISKESADELLSIAGISGDLRAQNLSIENWLQLTSVWAASHKL